MNIVIYVSIHIILKNINYFCSHPSSQSFGFFHLCYYFMFNFEIFPRFFEFFLQTRLLSRFVLYYVTPYFIRCESISTDEPYTDMERWHVVFLEWNPENRFWGESDQARRDEVTSFAVHHSFSLYSFGNFLCFLSFVSQKVSQIFLNCFTNFQKNPVLRVFCWF